MPFWLEKKQQLTLNVDPIPVPLSRTVEDIEYEKAIIVRDFYKTRLEKTKHVHGIMATKEVEELHMNLRISELNLEKAEMNLNR